jgi:uncharacterized damage-inducible protein DinB
LQAANRRSVRYRIEEAFALNADIEFMLSLVEEGYSRKTWHGPNLKGALRGLSAKQAEWRPGRHRHNIWEIAVHTAYWKYAVRRRILGLKRGSFPTKGSNWFVRTGLDEAALRADLRLLDEEHAGLLEAIAGLDPRVLHQRAGDSKNTFATLIRGIANHDVYHAGQIQLLKRLMS